VAQRRWFCQPKAIHVIHPGNHRFHAPMRRKKWTIHSGHSFVQCWEADQQYHSDHVFSIISTGRWCTEYSNHFDSESLRVFVVQREIDWSWLQTNLMRINHSIDWKSLWKQLSPPENIIAPIPLYWLPRNPWMDKSLLDSDEFVMPDFFCSIPRDNQN
jgi:hypothetical protein